MKAEHAEEMLVWYFQRAWEAAGRSWDADNAQEVRSIADDILAAAVKPEATPDGSWLRCVDHVHGGEDYPLNPAHVICYRRRDGWWRAFDVAGEAHDVCAGDEAKVQALVSGRLT